MPAAWTPRCKKQLAIQKSCETCRVPFSTLNADKQLGQPLRLGGCGMPIPSLTFVAAAWLSSAALTQVVLRQAPALFRLFDGPHHATLQRTGHVWETLNTSAAGLSSPETVRPCKQPSSTAPWRRQGTALATTNPCAPMQPCSTPPTVSPTTQMLVLARLCSAACRAASA
jgi:hypothetical protein